MQTSASVRATSPWVCSLGASFLLSAFSLFLLAARIVRTERPEFAFLGWNLLLGWLACALCHAACAAWDRQRTGSTVLLVAAFWAMFPNAFYLVTDLIHLRRTQGPLWHDFALLFSSAAAGVAIALHCMREVHRRAHRSFGRGFGWISIGLLAGSTGYAIWLGRVFRLNSWDVLVAPSGRCCRLQSTRWRGA
jgi:uncharacterized membrane protein